MTPNISVDEVQRRIVHLFQSTELSFDEVMAEVAKLEPFIIDQYSQGLTAIVPNHLVTADDLVH